MKSLEQKIINFVARYNLIEKNDNLLISFSGGPDSVFALYFFNKFKKKYKIKIAAIHFNHQLRGKESDEDEMFCSEFCKKLDIPFYSFRLNVKDYAKKNKLSIEEAARELRYNFLDKFSIEENYNKILTAHNLNDNTETILLNLFSGTGFSGLSGIPIKRGKIIRPLLCISKDEILEYLNQNNINYRIDSSNLQNDFKRNIIRNEILPLIRKNLNPKVDSAIFRSSKLLENFHSIIEKHTNELTEKYIRISRGNIFIKLSAQKIDDGILGEILKRILKDNFNYSIEYDDLMKIKSLFDKQTGKEINISKKIKAIRERNYIGISLKKEESNSFFNLKVGEKIKIDNKTLGIEEVDKNKIKLIKRKNIEYISADKLSNDFILRKWEAGDKFIPLGMKKLKKVSNFLTDEKIKSSEKKDKFVLVNNNLIVWVVGHRIDDRVKITSQTKRILKLWIK